VYKFEPNEATSADSVLIRQQVYPGIAPWSKPVFLVFAVISFLYAYTLLIYTINKTDWVPNLAETSSQVASHYGSNGVAKVPYRYIRCRPIVQEADSSA